jgi:diguanylate cyclase (GGDEF)-like protein/PAS domain S-box-containing protein
MVNIPINPQDLRQQAEASLHKNRAVATPQPSALSAENAAQLIHELQVHQIELEMQNDELRRAQTELSALQAHYFDLFDLAPVGYLTINAQGLLLQANLTAATLLGVTRQKLPRHSISHYILKADQDIYYRHRKKLVDSGATQDCELRLKKADGSTFWAHMVLTTAPAADGTQVLRMVVKDISERRLADDRLRVSQAALNAVSQGVMIADADRFVLSSNEAFTSITGYSAADVLGRDCKFLLGPRSDPTCVAAIRLALQNQTEFAGEILNYRKDGSTFWNELSISPVRNTEGVLTHFVGVTCDITERKHAQEALQQSEQRFRHFFEANSSVMLLIEPLSGQIKDANRSAVRFYGYSRGKLLSLPISHINTLSPKQIAAEMQLALHEKRRHFVFSHRLASGELRQVEVYSTPIQSGERALLFSIVHDITERRLLEDKVRQMAFYDPLTQLPNRRVISDRLTQSMALSKRSGDYCALMVLDLDNFKPLNDLHGHLVGDLLLIEVARRLCACVREVDTVGRFGGDEFVVVLGSLDADVSLATAQATHIAEKIRISLAEPYHLKVHHDDHPDTLVEHHCTASIGVLMFTDNDNTQTEIFKWADAAMYQAKDKGRNRMQFGSCPI